MDLKEELNRRRISKTYPVGKIAKNSLKENTLLQTAFSAILPTGYVLYR